MLKGVAAASIVLSTTLAMTGCMTKQGEVGNKNLRSNSYRAQSLNNPRFANDGLNETNRIHGTQRMNNNVAGLHGNSNLELSQDIADKLSALPEIKSAYVALTDRNAYVAIVEDRDGLNRSGRGTIGTNSLRGGGSPVTPYSMGATPRAGVSSNLNQYRSHYSADGLHYYHKDQIPSVPRTGMQTRARDGYRSLATDGNSALNGLGDGTTGYNGAAPADISDELKNKVADIVKGMHPTAANVYVSANPDFYGRMQSFAADVGSGHPIRGIVNQFNALVNRIFPENAGTTR